jgi:hypothetical protein
MLQSGQHQLADMYARLAIASLGLVIAAGSPAQQTHQVLACVVAQLEGNTTYFGTATTATKLLCEIDNPNIYPTLPELYAQGWRLIDVLGGDHAIAMGNRGPSPLYLLERPVPAGEQVDAARSKGSTEQ